MEFTTVRNKQDQLDAVHLSISVFKPNMAEQFELLFSEANWHHMFIAKDADKVVSLVNYYPSTIILNNVRIKAASIGSVCTNPEYRGKKLASTLLAMAEKSIKTEGIEMMIISGAGGIYADIGASLAGNDCEYLYGFESISDNSDYVVSDYQESDFSILKQLYAQEIIRFERGDDEFKRLLKGQTFPDAWATYPIQLIYKSGLPVAYVIGALPNDGDEFGIKEFAGDRTAIVESFGALLKKYHRQKIHFASDAYDVIRKSLSGIPFKVIHQYASLKIVDFVALMEKLKPYFQSRYTKSKIWFNLEDGSLATFHCDHETFHVPNSHLLSQLVFGFDQPVQLDLTNSPKLAEFFTKVFPLPFVWTNNINYQ